MRDIPIIVLAAGASRRMRGADKLMEVVDGMPLLRLQAKRALAATIGQVYVTLPPMPHPRYDVLDGLNVEFVTVSDTEMGISTSIKAGISALPNDAKAALITLADMPDIAGDDLKTVLDAVDLNSGNQIWRGSTNDDTPGHPIVFAAALFERLADLKGDQGAREIVSGAKGQTQLVPLPANHARLDLDTPEDWAAWRQRAINKT